jgi:predicted DNA-binding protein
MEASNEVRKAMTITLHLPPETERKLQEWAARTGQTVEGYVQDLVERVVRGTNGAAQATETAASRAGEKTLAEILAPIHEDFRKSGLTEAELDALLKECREEVWQEKQAGKG